MLLVGREQQLRVLAEQLDLARAGGTRVLLVEGEAGMGKTVLVDHLQQTLGGVPLRRVVGEPVEQAVPFGVLGQLWPELRLDLRDAQPAVADMGAAVLGWLWEHQRGRHARGEVGRAAGRQAEVVASDDPHWADEPSLPAQPIALRRMAYDPLPVALTRRTSPRPGAARPRPAAACLWNETTVNGTAVNETAAERSVLSIVGDLPGLAENRSGGTLGSARFRRPGRIPSCFPSPLRAWTTRMRWLL